jgi:hypothetical protein
MSRCLSLRDSIIEATHASEMCRTLLKAGKVNASRATQYAQKLAMDVC